LNPARRKQISKRQQTLEERRGEERTRWFIEQRQQGRRGAANARGRKTLAKPPISVGGGGKNRNATMARPPACLGSGPRMRRDRSRRPPGPGEGAAGGCRQGRARERERGNIIGSAIGYLDGGVGGGGGWVLALPSPAIGWPRRPPLGRHRRCCAGGRNRRARSVRSGRARVGLVLLGPVSYGVVSHPNEATRRRTGVYVPL
jgi:hypothetical protein